MPHSTHYPADEVFRLFREHSVHGSYQRLLRRERIPGIRVRGVTYYPRPDIDTLIHDIER